jgi:hypothetical protein
LPLDLTLNRAREFAILDLKHKILLPISRVLGYGGFAASAACLGDFVLYSGDQLIIPVGLAFGYFVLV